VNAAAPWAPRALHASVVHDGKMWIMGVARTWDTRQH